MTEFHDMKAVDPKTAVCALHKLHTPKPLRYVEHHIVPQSAGGQSVTTNEAVVCDTGHYNVHRLLDELRANFLSSVVPPTLAAINAHRFNAGGTRTEQAMARAGFWGAVQLGTWQKVPDE